jgi:hypothetical protein
MHPAPKQSHRPSRRSRILLLTLGGLLVGCAQKSGVQAPVPVRGDPVRVTTGDHREVHWFRELRGEVLVVRSGSGGDLLSIPLASVDGLEAVVAHRSRGSNALRGAAWGLGFGAGVGALLGLASGTSCGPNDWFCTTPAGGAAIGALFLGGLGGPLGLIIGAANPTFPVWAPVEPSALEVRAHASVDGLGLQLSWRP